MDTLYYKSGEYRLGKFKDSERLFCSGKKYNDCKKYIVADIDRYVLGISAKSKKWNLKKGKSIPKASVYKNLRIR